MERPTAFGRFLPVTNDRFGSKATCSAIAAEHTHLFAIDPVVSQDGRSGN